MRWLILCACALLAACGDNNEASPSDAGMDGQPDAPAALTGCLESPSLDMPPTGQLPCDLVPPGLTL